MNINCKTNKIHQKLIKDQSDFENYQALTIMINHDKLSNFL